MSLQDLETKTSDFINTNYPSELWIRVYTDVSSEEAVRNGGGGVLIEWLDGTKIENSIPTGRLSTNYKAEAAAIEEAVALLHTPKSYNKNIVLLSDAKSVLQALHNPRNREHSNLKASLLQLGLSAQQIVLQWLPEHCNIIMGEHKSRSTCERRISARTAGWRQLICRVQNSCQSSDGSKMEERPPRQRSKWPHPWNDP